MPFMPNLPPAVLEHVSKLLVVGGYSSNIEALFSHILTAHALLDTFVHAINNELVPLRAAGDVSAPLSGPQMHLASTAFVGLLGPENELASLVAAQYSGTFYFTRSLRNLVVDGIAGIADAMLLTKLAGLRYLDALVKISDSLSAFRRSAAGRVMGEKKVEALVEALFTHARIVNQVPASDPLAAFKVDPSQTSTGLDLSIISSLYPSYFHGVFPEGTISFLTRAADPESSLTGQALSNPASLQANKDIFGIPEKK